jgi:hypothetical protein
VLARDLQPADSAVSLWLRTVALTVCGLLVGYFMVGPTVLWALERLFGSVVLPTLR